MLVSVWCRRADSDIERLFSLQFKYMLTLFAHLRGRIGMQHRGLFSLSGCVLKAI